jgi:S-DNA-T family DNA segregation ATPase FtsK/SpoIIIE
MAFAIEALDAIYAVLGLSPTVCVVAYFVFRSNIERAMFVVCTMSMLSVAHLALGGLFGWCARVFIPAIIAYIVARLVRTKSPAPVPVPTRPTISKPIVLSKLPGIELLNVGKSQQIDVQDRRTELLGVLQDFGVGGVVHGMRSGPAVTLYEFEPAAGTKISKIVALTDDIARSLSVISVRIAKVPGKNFVGIEIANKAQDTVYFRDVVQSGAQDCILPLALGKDIAGKPMMTDLAKMPHLLVAGTTGSGKSVAIHAMLMSLLYKLTYKELRLLLIDPKMLEFAAYNSIPHLLHPVVTDPKEAVVSLKWAVREMERRYKLMSDCNVRNIVSYNSQFEPLPYIVVVVDEMADLMVVAGKEIECAVQRLAQMARASGIHIIMATQRPSVDVITGTIKANFPSRISFQVSSKIDSRTIIGEQGAEQLLGRGDMLYLSTGGRLVRVHGPFLTEDEVNRITDYLRALAEPEYVEDITVEQEVQDLTVDAKESDARYAEALELVRKAGKASTSFLVTNMGIGYNRASRIIQQMEREGIVSEAQGGGHVRQVLK